MWNRCRTLKALSRPGREREREAWALYWESNPLTNFFCCLISRERRKDVMRTNFQFSTLPRQVLSAKFTLNLKRRVLHKTRLHKRRNPFLLSGCHATFAVEFCCTSKFLSPWRRFSHLLGFNQAGSFPSSWRVLKMWHFRSCQGMYSDG